jgi:hypothetical protein
MKARINENETKELNPTEIGERFISFKSEKLLNKVRNVIGIPEFQPIVEMCEVWLSERDESKYEKTNKELLESYMNTYWIDMGWFEKFTCRFVYKVDFMNNTERARCWIECVTNYLINSKTII